MPITKTLEHQTQQEAENRQRQQRRQKFLDSVPDTKIDCPPVPANIAEGSAGADNVTSPDLLTPLPPPIPRHPDPTSEKIEKFHI